MAKRRKRKRGARRQAKTAGTGAAPAARQGVLKRLLGYGEKTHQTVTRLRAVGDERVKPRIPAGRVALGYLLVLLARLGSLNALEQRKAPPAWVKWLGGALPSADVMGDVAATMNLGDLHAHNKHVIAVLKNENRDLLEDARSLLAHTVPIPFNDNKVRRTCWDLEGFTTGPQCGEKVRVMRSLERTTVRRQKGREQETLESEWFWVTRLPVHLASTKTIVRAGHGRWGIENHGFNELSNQ